MDEDKIIKMYVNDHYTLRQLAGVFNTNHHMIKRILIKNNIKITRKNSLKKFSTEHKRKISESRKKLVSSGWIPYNKGLKTIERKNGKELLLKNMQAHLKYKVSVEWLGGFDDIEKLKYLNYSISRKRDNEGFTTEIYMQFIEKFYYDIKFNLLYNEWKSTKDKWIKPSLDHIIAKSNNGNLLLENLQFISWFENRAKSNIPPDTWKEMKKKIGYYL
jgi:hypothetical protein